MDKYQVLDLIGAGLTGIVEKIKRIEDNKILVWKKLDYSSMQDKEKSQIVSEVNILRELKHPNIVRYYDRVINKETSQIYIVQEYCECGDLQQYIKRMQQKRQNIPEQMILQICMHVVFALHEIHNRKEGKILHRDLKPANLFMDSKNNIKLGDFGFSKKLQGESEYAYTNIGTPHYMSPEQINDNKYNEKSDIWSLGCLLYELSALRPPFSASSQLSLAVQIKNGKFARIPSIYSDELMRIIIWCLHKNLDCRPSTTDLLSTPFISYRLRELKLQENLSIIQSRESEIQKRQNYLDEKERRIFKKMQKIQKKIENFENNTGNNDKNSKFHCNSSVKNSSIKGSTIDPGSAQRFSTKRESFNSCNNSLNTSNKKFLSPSLPRKQLSYAQKGKDISLNLEKQKFNTSDNSEGKR